jgi:hypothetical protein
VKKGFWRKNKMSAADAIHKSDKKSEMELFQNSHEQSQHSPTENFCTRLSQECHDLLKSVTDQGPKIVITEGAIVGVVAAAIITHRMFPEALPAIKRMLGFGRHHYTFTLPMNPSFLYADHDYQELINAVAKDSLEALARSRMEINPITTSRLGSALEREAAVKGSIDFATTRELQPTQPAIDALLKSGTEIKPQTGIISKPGSK